MARSSASKKSKQISIRVGGKVRWIRRRHAQAVSLGYSPEEAARLAHSDEAIVPRSAAAPKSVPVVKEPEPDSKPVAAASDSKTEVKPQGSQSSAVVDGGVSKPDSVKISGSASPVFNRDDIPPNWQELPWPALKKLAMQVSNSNVHSRNEAVEIIEKALAI